MKDISWEEYQDENCHAIRNLDKEKISDFVDVLIRVREDNGTVWVLGNGGSASTASHAVGDFTKTSKALGAKALMTIAPSEMTSLQSAYANDESFERAFANTIRDFCREKDAVWFISVSGQSPNLIEAHRVAKEKGINTLSIVGSQGLEFADACDVGIVISSEDYQIVENAQVALMHYFTKCLALKF